jgi:hypothetical protein
MRVGVDPTARHTPHYEPWPGIRGRQHGEVNETIPATNARANGPRTLMACPGEHIVERGLQDLSILVSQEPVPDRPLGSRELEFLNPSATTSRSS